jgi:hypothetical protein
VVIQRGLAWQGVLVSITRAAAVAVAIVLALAWSLALPR